MRRKNIYAVVTGASAGLGIEFSKRLAAEGYDLILVARREEKLKSLAKELEKIGAKSIIITADLSKIDECRRLMDEIIKEKVSIFINNAGFGDCGFFPETNLDKDLGMIDLNVKAVHFFTKEMVALCERQGGGYLLNVASSAGLIPAGPYMATYYATKAYVTSLTRAVSVELKEHKSNVYVGCLCPGPVDTEFNDVANVEFALPGISASFCANYAIDMMKKKKTVIIPTVRMKMALFGKRIISEKSYIKITGHQQKKKLAN